LIAPKIVCTTCVRWTETRHVPYGSMLRRFFWLYFE